MLTDNNDDQYEVNGDTQTRQNDSKNLLIMKIYQINRM